MKLITIIPAYNEENKIENVIKNSLRYSDVLVVDDGSEDGTFELSKNAGATVIKHQKNQGKGAALKTGLKSALEDNYDAIILIDGDCQHDPSHIPILASKTEYFDLIIGSRFIQGNPLNMPLQRKISNKLTTKIMHHLTGYHLTDSQSGFRALSSNVANFFLNIEYDDYVYESEMLYQCYKNNLTIHEVEIPCIYGDERSDVTLANALNYLWFVTKRIVKKTKRFLP